MTRVGVVGATEYADAEFVRILSDYRLRDLGLYSSRNTSDFITQLIWNRRQSNQLAISREDLISFLDNANEDLLRTQRWTESTRNGLAASILTALRDFGLLKGTHHRHFARGLDIFIYGAGKAHWRKWLDFDTVSYLGREFLLRLKIDGNAVPGR